MSTEELTRLCRSKSPQVTTALTELQADYKQKSSSVILVEEADGWKLTVHEDYAAVVSKVISETELSKSLMETLAVVAWKAPVLQSDIIRIRTNKAYTDLTDLEHLGYITRNRHGRTRLVKLTERFFSYFNVRNNQDIQSKFQTKPEPVPKPIQDPSALLPILPPVSEKTASSTS